MFFAKTKHRRIRIEERYEKEISGMKKEFESSV
jgi:hypothetical protein